GKPADLVVAEGQTGEGGQDHDVRRDGRDAVVLEEELGETFESSTGRRVDQMVVLQVEAALDRPEIGREGPQLVVFDAQFLELCQFLERGKGLEPVVLDVELLQQMQLADGRGERGEEVVSQVEGLKIRQARYLRGQGLELVG